MEGKIGVFHEIGSYRYQIRKECKLIGPNCLLLELRINTAESEFCPFAVAVFKDFKKEVIC